MAKRWSKYEDDPDRRWYGLAVWKNTRARHLAQHPLCVFCLKDDKTTVATVVDHINEWRKALPEAVTVHGKDPGDCVDDVRDARWTAFLDEDNLQSLCKLCHDSTKQIIEKGVKPEIGLDGWPVDD